MTSMFIPLVEGGWESKVLLEARSLRVNLLSLKENLEYHYRIMDYSNIIIMDYSIMTSFVILRPTVFKFIPISIELLIKMKSMNSFESQSTVWLVITGF